MLCAVIMAGGIGTRFWPLSTEKKPKQFLKLIGEDTMIQMTVNRIKPIIPIERIFICTGKRYVNLVKSQLPNLPERNIIIEPEGRNTAPCIALSAMVIKRYYKGATMVILPSDHLIKDEDKFRETIKDGYEFLNDYRDSIITLGMKPNRAETGYGYIKCSKEKININLNKVLKVEAFVEKPNKETAKKYLEDGSYLWNGGMFIWRIDDILNKFNKYLNNTYEVLKEIKNQSEDTLQDFIDKNYKYTDSTSVDYGILEKSNEIYVIPSEIGWDDIGTWRAIERYREKDENMNIVSKNVRVIESKDNLAINRDKRLVMIGLEHIMALETEDSIFVVNKDCIDSLKEYKGIV